MYIKIICKIVAWKGVIRWMRRYLDMDPCAVDSVSLSVVGFKISYLDGPHYRVLFRETEI